VVYRETVIDRPPALLPAVLVVSFRLRHVNRGWAHSLFRPESELNTVLFAGFPGLVSKLWLLFAGARGFALLVSYCDGGVDRPSQCLRVRLSRQAGERSERYVRRVRRDVQGADRDLEEVKDDADQTLRQHPRFAAMVGLVSGVLREQSAERVGLAASGAAFWVVISALPTVVAVVSLFGLAVSPERVTADLGTLARDAPSSLGGLLTEQLRQVTVSDHAGVSLGLAVSVLLAVWSASAGVYNLHLAIRVAYGLAPQSFVEARGRALMGAVAVVVLVGVTAIATSVGQARTPGLWAIVGIPVALLVITAAVGALYRFAVGRRVGVRALLPGAVTSAVGIVLVTSVFGAYVSVSTRYTAVYGALAGVVIGMLAVYLAVYVILLGAVFNMQLSRRRSGDR
jgi:membrane protein